MLLGIASHEGFRQKWDVGWPFSEWWHVNRNHIEAKEEVLTKLLALDTLCQIPIGGGNDPNIHADGACATHSFKFSFLKHPQELGLNHRRDFTDLIQEYRPTMSQLKPSLTARYRSGKSSLFMTKEFALDQVVGNRRTINGDERLFGSCAVFVDGARNQFLTGTTLALNQHRRLGARHLPNQIIELLDGG